MTPANKKLDDAVDQFLRETEWNKAGALTHYILIGHQVAYDNEGYQVDTYPVIYKGGFQPDYVNFGLLGVAQAALNATRWQMQSDD